MDIYVGNLPYETDEDSLKHSFAEYGNVESVRIITDRDTGRSKGFGFVKMSNNEEANVAIKSLDGQDYGGRTIKVNESRQNNERPSGGRGGFRGNRDGGNGRRDRY